MSPSTVPQLNTAITHLREVLGDQTYESHTCKGETMITAAMVTYAYDHIDQARTELKAVSKSRPHLRHLRWSTTVPRSPWSLCLYSSSQNMLGLHPNQALNERGSLGVHDRLGITPRPSRGGQQITSRSDKPATQLRRRPIAVHQGSAPLWALHRRIRRNRIWPVTGSNESGCAE